jgi:hypothetical protein
MTGEYNPEEKLDVYNHPLMGVTLERLAAIQAGEQERLGAALEQLESKLNDRTTDIKLKLSPVILGLEKDRREYLVGHLKQVDDFVVDVVNIKQDNSDLTDEAIHEQVASDAEQNPTNETAIRLEISTMLLSEVDPAIPEADRVYIFTKFI